jgi:autoinducer 2-degrading protein
MVVTTVHVDVKADCINDFIEATIANHQASIKEPGNCRFDVLQSDKIPTQFLLYEAYDSEQSAAAHKQTAHYLQWRERVASMMAQPRCGTPYTAIRP